MMRGISIGFVLILAAAPLAGQEIGWIGISIDDQRDHGPIIRSIDPNSPAARAGLREGDIIIQFNNENVVGARQLARLIRETPVGRTVDIKVQRDNREETFHVTIDRANFRAWPDDLDFQLRDFRMLRDRVRDFPQIQVNTTYVQSGIRVESLTDQLRHFFGVYSSYGVLVASVSRDSAAEKAGLKAGDVIVSVDGRTIRTPAEFSREMRTAGSKAALKIVRDKKEQEIKLE